MSQDVLRAGFPLLVSYHCTNIFTRDNILGLGTMYFFFAGPHHLDFLSFFFFFLIPKHCLSRAKTPTGWETQMGWWYRAHWGQITKLTCPGSVATLRSSCTSWLGLCGKFPFVYRETWENQAWSEVWSPTGPALLSLMEEPKNKTEATSVNTGIISFPWYR